MELFDKVKKLFHDYRLMLKDLWYDDMTDDDGFPGGTWIGKLICFFIILVTFVVAFTVLGLIVYLLMNPSVIAILGLIGVGAYFLIKWLINVPEEVE